MTVQTFKDSQELPLITFNSLTSLLREEQKSKVLQKLPEKFYEGYQNFIKEKEEEALKYTQNRETSKAIKEQKVIMGSTNKVQELLNLRLIKISTLATKNTIFSDEEFSTENLIEQEKPFYEKIETEIKKATKLIK